MEAYSFHFPLLPPFFSFSFPLFSWHHFCHQLDQALRLGLLSSAGLDGNSIVNKFMG